MAPFGFRRNGRGPRRASSTMRHHQADRRDAPGGIAFVSPSCRRPERRNAGQYHGPERLLSSPGWRGREGFFWPVVGRCGGAPDPSSGLRLIGAHGRYSAARRSAWPTSSAAILRTFLCLASGGWAILAVGWVFGRWLGEGAEEHRILRQGCGRSVLTDVIGAYPPVGLQVMSPDVV